MKPSSVASPSSFSGTIAQIHSGVCYQNEEFTIGFVFFFTGYKIWIWVGEFQHGCCKFTPSFHRISLCNRDGALRGLNLRDIPQAESENYACLLRLHRGVLALSDSLL
ncbi:hypothetical protein SLA2020_066980 [Shorea laevis]